MTLLRLTFCLIFLTVSTLSADETRSKVFAHYMPWFTNKEVSGEWGYHWTMNHFDPDIVKWNGKREVAAHDYPLLGLYDSSDPDILDCHAQLMKFAGLDGAVIDWYGIRDFYDYGAIHENTKQFISSLKKAGLQFAICYEDQTIGAMVKAKNLAENEAVPHGKEVMKWMAENWFSNDAYVKSGDQPVLPIFGPQYFSSEQWSEVLSSLTPRPKSYSLPHLAEGAELAWPPVESTGAVPKAVWEKHLAGLYSNDRETFGVAFPSFRDIYKQAGVKEKSYGRIDPQDGQTLRESLQLAQAHKLPFIQIATWNDFGEGTEFEPTHSLGYRHLEIAQEMLGTSRKYSAADLRLPIDFYHLKKRADGNETELSGKISAALFAGKTNEARELIATLKEKVEQNPVEPGSKYRLISEPPYRSGDEVSDYAKNRCKLDFYYPAGDKPYSTVIWFHGGGITRGNKEIPVPLRNKGVAVAAVNYRLNPLVKEPAYLEDAAAAVAWVFQNVHRYGAGDPKRIFVSGHSAGGYLASMIGLDKQYLAAFDIDANDIAGLIPFSGHTITHFTVRKERGIPGNQPIVDAMAPLFHVRKDSPPMLLITGDREKELWGRYEENAYFLRMMNVAGHKETTLRELEGFDHGGMPEPAFPLLLDFVEIYSK
ncbi:MAG: alpha/beta hydrolase fold domain-containing protein [Verrucomicrobiales bacterium]|nr:alpha/beta hydrolase fold domain-containing protein [Verrucomicrobiales bacterium]